MGLAEKVRLTDILLEKTCESSDVSFDDIGVKHQKEHRITDCDKHGVYVWNTVSAVQFCESTYTLTGVGMQQVFRNTLAFY